jgi:hypothetical protein
MLRASAAVSLGQQDGPHRGLLSVSLALRMRRDLDHPRATRRGSPPGTVASGIAVGEVARLAAAAPAGRGSSCADAVCRNISTAPPLLRIRAPPSWPRSRPSTPGQQLIGASGSLIEQSPQGFAWQRETAAGNKRLSWRRVNTGVRSTRSRRRSNPSVGSTLGQCSGAFRRHGTRVAQIPIPGRRGVRPSRSTSLMGLSLDVAANTGSLSLPWHGDSPGWSVGEEPSSQQFGALLRKGWPALVRATGSVSCQVVPLAPAQVGEVECWASALPAVKARPERASGEDCG